MYMKWECEHSYGYQVPAVYFHVYNTRLFILLASYVLYELRITLRSVQTKLILTTKTKTDNVFVIHLDLLTK